MTDTPARLVGLTGGIASGKSTVAALLERRGAVVIDADVLAHEVTAPGSPALEEISARLGAELVDVDGALDRAALARLVFSDSDARTALEEITHPRIRLLSQARVSAALVSGAPLVVFCAPLFFERGLEAWIPDVIVVDVDTAAQRRRLEARDGVESLARIASQLPLAQKRARATWIIDNSGSEEETRKQVETLWSQLVSAKTRPASD